MIAIQLKQQKSLFCYSVLFFLSSSLYFSLFLCMFRMMKHRGSVRLFFVRREVLHTCTCHVRQESNDGFFSYFFF